MRTLLLLRPLRAWPLLRPLRLLPLGSHWPLAQWPLLLAFALPLIVFWLQHDVGLSLLDEGFLWYGAQRVLQGELPLRDFQSYDIGRYLWHAAWMWLLGSDGVVALRAGSAVLAGCTVALMVLVLRRARPVSAPVLALAVATFALWMVPYFKVADSFATALLLAGLARLVASPSVRSWMLYGVCLGVAAAIGINHAFYGVLAAALFLAWARWHGMALLEVLDGRKLAAAVAGVAIGHAPAIACHLLVPGFTAAFIDSIRILAEGGTTNLGRPLHSFVTAWAAPGLPWTTRLREFLLSAVLLALAPAFGVVCVRRVLHRKGGAGQCPATPCSPVFVAAVITGGAYAHYVVSRADIAHLAVSVLPLLMAAWTFPWAARSPRAQRVRARWAALPQQALLLAFVFLFSGVLAAPVHALYQRLRGAVLQPVALAGEVLQVSPADARELAFLQQLHDSAVGPGAIYVAPYWPGAYAALRVRSPAWEIYAIFPATAERQRREIGRLQQHGVTVAVVQQARMDGRADLGFAQTHPLINAYLANCMVPLAAAPRAWMVPADVDVFVARPPADQGGPQSCPQP